MFIVLFAAHVTHFIFGTSYVAMSISSFLDPSITIHYLWFVWIVFTVFAGIYLNDRLDYVEYSLNIVKKRSLSSNIVTGILYAIYVLGAIPVCIYAYQIYQMMWCVAFMTFPLLCRGFFYSSKNKCFALYCIASARWARVIVSEDSRSAMVWASLIIRWTRRPERWSLEAAVERNSFSSGQRLT